MFQSVSSSNDLNILSIQKNVNFSALRLILRKDKFALVLKNSKENEETYCSEKQLSPNKWYNIVISCSQDMGIFHKVSFFVNGFVDLQTSVSHYTPFENAQVVLGQYRTIDPFRGYIQNLMLYLYPVVAEEVRILQHEAENYFEHGQLPEFVQTVHAKSTYIENTENYLQKSKLPNNEFIKLGVNNEFFNEEEESIRVVNDEGEEEQEPDIHPVELLTEVFNSGEHDELI